MYKPTFRFFILFNLFIILTSAINMGCEENNPPTNNNLKNSQISISDTFTIQAPGKQYKKGVIHKFFFGSKSLLA